jgi:hypothetical protein
MIVFLIKLIAWAALQAQPTLPPTEFTNWVMQCDTPEFRPGVFIGCKTVYTGPDEAAQGEIYYAGLRWDFPNTEPELVTGP